MIKHKLISFMFAFAFIAFSDLIIAQENTIGTVKYEKTTKFNFEKTDNPRWNSHIASLPSEVKHSFVLYFDTKKAFFDRNPENNELPDRSMRWAMHRQNFGKSPRSQVQTVYYNLDKKNKIEQLEFMTRSFLIESEMETPAWKITGKQSKILNHLCLSAEILIDDETVVAWFTPQVPVSLGPSIYYGLPGLIMAVEKDGETIYLATSVDLSPPDQAFLQKPKEGKKVSPEEFEQIRKEKIEEFKANRGSFEGRGRHK